MLKAATLFSYLTVAFVWAQFVVMFYMNRKTPYLLHDPVLRWLSKAGEAFYFGTLLSAMACGMFALLFFTA